MLIRVGSVAAQCLWVGCYDVPSTLRIKTRVGLLLDVDIEG